MNASTPQSLSDALQCLADAIAGPVDDDPTRALGVRIAPGSKLVSLERYREQPTFYQRRVAFREAREFVEYCTRFGSDGASGFASVRPLSATYLIDYGTPETPGWAAHRAQFAPQYSPQWQVWCKHHKQPMGHAAFANFIEEQLPDIRTPDAATMLELVQGFEASGSMTFSTGTKMQSGDVRLSYKTETRGSVRGGELDIPDRFMIAVPLYEFGALIELIAFLRYRIKEGELSMWYEFPRLEEALGEFDTGVLEGIREKVPRISLGDLSFTIEPVGGRSDG